MFTSARFESARANRTRSSPAALGPFPRSVWIHPLAPEDELDRVCFRIWKRSIWATRHIWPHLAEHAHRFADDAQLAGDVEDSSVHQCENQRNDGLPGLEMWQCEMDDINLMVQRELVLTLQQEYDTISSFQTTDGDCCSPGDDPDSAEEIVSTEEAQRKRIEKFLKAVLFADRDEIEKEVSEGPSLEDFPPLPRAALPWGERPAQKDPPKPQREPRKQRCQSSKPTDFTTAAVMEEVQASQASKAHNEPYSQLSRSCQTREVGEAANVAPVEAAVDGGQTSKKEGRSDSPVFAALQAGRMMIENRPVTGGDGLQGKSADGARVPHDLAGTDTACARKAAGPPQNARSPLFREDATALGRKTLSSTDDKVDVPIGHMAGIQGQQQRCDKAKWGKSSRYFPQKTSSPKHNRPRPAPTCPDPQRPARPPPGFTRPQITPESVLMACLSLSRSMLPPGCVGVPPAYVLQPLLMSGDSHQQHFPFLNSDNFPDNVNPQGASRQRFMRTPNGFGSR